MEGSNNYWICINSWRTRGLDMVRAISFFNCYCTFVSTVTTWVLLIGKILFKEKVMKLAVLGVIMGSIGFVMLIIPSLAAQFLEFDSPGNTFELVCIFALTIAALSWSVGSLYSSNS